MTTRRGLQEPLLPPANNDRSDIESGATADDDNSHDEESVVPLFRRSYRPSVVAVAAIDLLATVAIAYDLDRGAAFFPPKASFAFGSSVTDVVWICVARAVLLIVQASKCGTVRAAKVSGYTALLSLLFVTIKACAGTKEQWSVPLWVALMVLQLACCFAECVCEVLVTTYSSKDTSSTVAPTAREAAEGLSLDANKSIGFLDLLKVLRPYFWPDGLLNRGCVFLTWIFLVLSKASNILAPLFIAKATDNLPHDSHSTVLNVIAYAGLLFCNKAFKEAQAMAYIRVKLIAGVQLKERVFTHLLSLSMEWHQRKSTGAVNTAMQRGITASNMVVQYIFLYLFPTFIEAIVVSIVFVKAFGAPLLGACAICGGTLYVVVTMELTIWRMQFRKRMNKADNDAGNKVFDALVNFEAVKYFTGESHEVSRYRESIDVYQDNAFKIQGSLSLLNTSQQIVLNCTLVAALLVAAHEYNVGHFSVGQFVAVNVYVMQLFAPLNFLGTIYGMAIGSYVDLSNLCNIMAEQPDIEDREDAKALAMGTSSSETTAAVAADGGIVFRDVAFAYPSRKEVQVLKGISFAVPPGTTTAVVGETGSGKSTLTRLLFRFYEADRGQVIVGGQDVLDVTQKSLRENLGMVPQDPSLFNDTLAYNVRYGSRDADDGAVQRAVEAARLEDFVAGLPDGLETVVGERGQQISGGQKQRIAIARVLIRDTPVVVLDEATSSLDSQTEAQVQAALESLKGRTMLVIAHRLSTIQNANEIIVMSQGEILERGTHENLLSKGNWHERCYASLWERQKKADRVEQ